MKTEKNLQNSKRIHAFNEDCLGNHDAVGIANLIKKKEISVQEVTTAAIERANIVEPFINAIEFDMFSQGVSSLNQVDQTSTGIFSGIPTFIKDNVDLKNAPTNYGSAAVNSQPAVEDGEFISQYLKLGFVPMGKSSMPELGFNASTEYMHRAPTRNPWSLEYSCGASSGGSAALVASGVVPIAHANDGGGSIRIPAACCGLIGLKPTRGRLISPESMRKLPIDIVTQGVLTRSVRDTAHFYSEIEKIYQDPSLPPLGLVEGPSQKKIKIGMVLDSIVGNPTCYETRSTVINTAKLFEGMGHEIEEVSFPVSEIFAKDFFTYWGMISFFIAKFGRRTMDPSFDASKLDMLSKGLVNAYKKQMLKTPVVIYRLKRVYQQLEALFSQFDIILSPVVAHTTPKIGYLKPGQPFDELHRRLFSYANFTPLNNAAGNPGISLPVGTSSIGLPIGVHLSSAKGHERILLELAYASEMESPWEKITRLSVK